MTYIKRTQITAIQYLLKHFPCVAILGARQVGKTTLLKQVASHRPFFDLEKTSDYERIDYDPDFFLSQYQEPIVIDEAQLLPKLFPALRVAIDAKRQSNGSYLLSGSSSPALLKQISESLAGRIAIFELSGLSLNETWNLPPSLFFKYIIKKDFSALLKLKPRLSTHKLLTSCFLGTYPEPLTKYTQEPKAFQLWMENYFKTYIERDILRLFPGLNIPTYKKFLNMLANSSGQILNASEFSRSLSVSQPTIKNYYQIAHGTYIWRMLPNFQKNLARRITKMPRGHIRDTGLLNYILKNYTLEDLNSHPLIGRIWETFIIEEIIKGFHQQLVFPEISYYRTRNQAEIDLILEGPFGTLPIEIKLGTVTSGKALKALQTFVDDMQLKLGILINNSQNVAWLTKKILQVPASCL